MATLNATYKVTSEPATEPVSVATLKERLRITTGEFDRELADLLKAARKQVENDAHIKLVTQTVALYLDRFPPGNVIEIRQLPVTAVTSVQYVDENETTQTLSSSLYNVDLNSKPVRVMLVPDEDWEDTEAPWPAAVTVTFTAGYGVASAVPVEAKLAIIEWCRMHWGRCDGDQTKYTNLVNSLAWSGYWKGI